MPTRTEIEQELRRTLSQVAGSAQVESRWDDLVNRIESGDERAPSVVASPRGRGSRWKPGVVFVAAFVTVVVVIGLSGLLGGRAPETDSPVGGSTAPASGTTLAVPAVVWPPAIPTVEGQTDAVWHCPEIDVQPDVQLDRAQVPDDLRYLPTGDASVRSAWGVNYGPGCARSPALVAVTFANEQQTGLSAVVVVWVEQPTNHHWSAEPSSVKQGSATRPGDTISWVDGFTVRQSTAGGVDQVEAVGIVDGLPIWIESSGVTSDRLLELAGTMTATPETGRVHLAETFDEFEVVHSGSVDAEVADHITWYVEGPGIGQSLEVTTNPAFNPYEIAVGVTNGLQLVEVGGNPAVLAGEEGGTERLTWEIQQGIEATVIAEGSELTQIAESLTQVDPTDPRLPTG